MKLSTFLVGTLAPIATLALECYNEDFDHDPMNITAEHRVRALTDLRDRATITIDLWIHMLVPGPTAADGYVDATGLLRQVDYLQRQYNKWGFAFQVKPISYALNAEWASDIDPQKAEKMRQLHRGDYKSLNVYCVKGAGGGVCSLPNSSGQPVDQTTLDGDGCFVPLDVCTSPNSGTLAHEIGHWFGLLHVFQGGCTGDGDFCADTAPQANPSYGKMSIAGDLNSCPAGHSCSASQSDNVNNFMDYTDCSHEFTTCQGARMSASYTNYRANRAIAAGVLWK
ncbi:pregnancy-associated plasma protein-A-domain-containing protein [Clohesyomyces aquaticus]|uniref:Pregnancy-associated plasma protein-A-domain-containing protein n=1 Tax=Clohesyomyces aquaticus TaxID=1231657 RepID=A0A1Y1ZY54_9PLEO|nr:pregnancy-associated plasma protein-A-domain-containing protein [Clohesyomyces aquaticus]